jgi:hypothetical protein
VIVVVGSPIAEEAESGHDAAGPAVSLARVAASSGAVVELVGRVGEDAAGDAVLLSLADAGIGHVAMLRDPSRATPINRPRPAAADAADGADAEPADAEPADADTAAAGPGDASRRSAADEAPPAGLPLDAADVELAMRYLPDCRVIVVAAPLRADAVEAIVGATRWSGAQLIAIVGFEAPAGLPPEATVLEAPTSDPDGAFAAIVAAYAVGLDRGASPADAFRSASGELGVTAVRD